MQKHGVVKTAGAKAWSCGSEWGGGDRVYLKTEVGDE